MPLLVPCEYTPNSFGGGSVVLQSNVGKPPHHGKVGTLTAKLARVEDLDPRSSKVGSTHATKPRGGYTIKHTLYYGIGAFGLP